ncbi:MAG: sigma-70 family RNA polymerase sigma factor [Planctomycetes bacterium]|nr:sigma-70 family RNA polymerase sigma factor [Planctomycetota bacterium]
MQDDAAASLAPKEDDSLVQLAKEDSDAFVELYRRHYDMIFRYCVHRLLSRELAEDMSSQVFLKVVDRISDFEGNSRQFRAWLYAIATNEINGHFRKTIRRTRLIRRVDPHSNGHAAECPSAVMDLANRQAVIREALRSLKPNDQTIITLRFTEDLSTADIAGVLGIKEGSVRARLSRALKKLRDTLEPVWQAL